MRSLIFLSPLVLLASCADLVSQREILRRAQIEVAARESWANDAFVIIEEKPDTPLRITWQVKAGELDRSESPKYQGIHIVPGTERKLRFTRGGCLVSYAYAGSPCLYPPTSATPAAVESGARK